MDDAIIVAAKKSPRKLSMAIQAGLARDVGNLSSQLKIRRRLSSSNLKSYAPSNKPALSAKNIADHLRFCRKYQGCRDEQ